MRTVQTAATTLTGFEQRKKEEAEKAAAESKPVDTAEKAVSQDSEASADSNDGKPPFDVDEPPTENSEAADTAREETLASMPGPKTESAKNSKSKPRGKRKTKKKDTPAGDAKPPEAESAADQPATDDTAGEERKLLDAIFKVENELIALVEEESNVSTVLEDLQAQLRHARQTKELLLKNLPEALIRIRNGDTADSVVADTKDEATESLKPVVLEWHQLETRVVAKGIEGLGPEKLDKLCDQCPTIGDANNFRIAASELKVHFADKLPRGIGKKIANELEKRILDAETNHGTPSAAEQVESRIVEESKEVVTPGRDPHVRLVTSIERSIRATMDAPGALDSKDSDRWQAGYDAHESDQEITTCPDFDGDDKNPAMTEWIKGWLSSELLSMDKPELEPKTAVEAEEPKTTEQPGKADVKESVKDDPAVDEAEPEVTETEAEIASEEVNEGSVKEDEPEADQQPEPEATSEPTAEVDPDAHAESIAKLAETIKANGELRQQVKEGIHWGEGYSTSIDELPIESCPSDVSDESQQEWVRGWLYGNSFTEAL